MIIIKYLIHNYIQKLSIDDLNKFAINNNIILSENELNFIYSFIKKNHEYLLNNPNDFNIEKYKDKLSEENFIKIDLLINKYRKKYNI